MVNSAGAIADAMSEYYRMQAVEKAKAEPERVLTKLTVAEVLDKFVPQDFHVYTAKDVDLSTTINYETSRPWTEALGKPLSEAGIEMTADLDKKIMSLKVGTTTIAQVIGGIVPDDYTVYADNMVNLDTLITFDRSQPWIEELGKALGAVEVVMKINLDKKLILLKPKSTVHPASKPQEQAAPKGPTAQPQKQQAPSAKNRSIT